MVCRALLARAAPRGGGPAGGSRPRALVLTGQVVRDSPARSTGGISSTSTSSIAREGGHQLATVPPLRRRRARTGAAVAPVGEVAATALARSSRAARPHRPRDHRPPAVGAHHQRRAQFVSPPSPSQYRTPTARPSSTSTCPRWPVRVRRPGLPRRGHQRRVQTQPAHAERVVEPVHGRVGGPGLVRPPAHRRLGQLRPAQRQDPIEGPQALQLHHARPGKAGGRERVGGEPRSVERDDGAAGAGKRGCGC